MKNLENYGVQELGAKEKVEIGGGLLGIDDAAWAAIGIGVLLGIITTQDLDDLADAFMEGYNSARP
jgi:hypothetical protein